MKAKRGRNALDNEDRRLLRAGSSHHVKTDSNDIVRSSVRVLSRNSKGPSTDYSSHVPRTRSKSVTSLRNSQNIEERKTNSIFAQEDFGATDFNDENIGRTEDPNESLRVAQLISDNNVEIERIRKIAALYGLDPRYGLKEEQRAPLRPPKRTETDRSLLADIGLHPEV